MAQVTTDQTFQSDVLESQKPVLVDFWAEWCGPCRIVGPIVEELAEEYKDTLTVYKLDVDANQATSQKYNVMSIPSLLFFKNGEVVKTVIGAQPKDSLKKAIEEVLG